MLGSLTPTRSQRSPRVISISSTTAPWRRRSIRSIPPAESIWAARAAASARFANWPSTARAERAAGAAGRHPAEALPAADAAGPVPAGVAGRFSIARRDSWPGLDAWLAENVENRQTLDIGHNDAAEIGATAAGLLLERNHEHPGTFGLLSAVDVPAGIQDFRLYLRRGRRRAEGPQVVGVARRECHGAPGPHEWAGSREAPSRGPRQVPRAGGRGGLLQQYATVAPGSNKKKAYPC